MYKASCDGVTKQTLLNITSHILSNIKKLGKEFVNKYNIQKRLQFNKVDFERQFWTSSEHMLKVKPIPIRL